MTAINRIRLTGVYETGDARRSYEISAQPLRLARGETETIRMRVLTSAGAAVDLTGSAVVLTIRDPAGDAMVLARQATIDDAAGGLCSFAVVVGDTAALAPRAYYYDVWVLWGVGGDGVNGDHNQLVSRSPFVLEDSAYVDGDLVSVLPMQEPLGQGPAGADGPAGGPPGPQGEPGAPGAAGATGGVWRSGSGVPSNGLGANGDYYLDTATGNVYARSSGVYAFVATIKGPAGATGATGASGATGAAGPTGATGAAGATGASGTTWRDGSGPPDDGTGIDGDYWLDEITGDVYVRVASVYTLTANLKGLHGDPGADGAAGATGSTGATGAAGAAGALWYTSSGAPSGGTGVNGDRDLDSVSGDVYAKAGGSWSVVANIKGATGATGATGAQGIQGVTGSTGAAGAAGATGATGSTGATGAAGSVWRTGAGVPSDGTGVDGDFYLRDALGDVYTRAAGAYSVTANIKGATGATGAQGIQGIQGVTGATGAAGAAGSTGATGSAGAAGSVWRTGAGVPSNGTGVDGDFYLRDAVGDVYTRASGTYSVTGNIKGATGATGATGTSGTLTAAGDLTGGGVMSSNVTVTLPNTLTGKTFTGNVAHTVTATTGAVGSPLTITPPAHTAITASTEVPWVNIPAATWQWATGTITTQRFIRIGAPTIAFVGASTVTNAYTMQIAAPIASASPLATLTSTAALGLAAGAAASFCLVIDKTLAATTNNKYQSMRVNGTEHGVWQFDNTSAIDRIQLRATAGKMIQFGDASSIYFTVQNNVGSACAAFAGGPVDFGAYGITGVGQIGNGGAQQCIILGNNLIGFFGTSAQAKPTVTGSRASTAALGSLLTALNTLGLVTDSSST